METSVALAMYTIIPEQDLMKGYGKYKQRYEYLKKNGQGINDRTHLERLWQEIKSRQKNYPIYNLELKDNPIAVIFNTNREFYSQYTRDLLIRHYPDKGHIFVRQELDEYKQTMLHNPDYIELFDSLFMLAQYVIANKIRVELAQVLLNEILKTHFNT